MRLGIMQPYFFPFVGYFDTILKTDAWVVFDIVKYQPKTWMNRNRILDPKQGTTYVTVPVPKGSSHPLQTIEVKAPKEAGERIVRQLDVYRQTAPKFDAVMSLVEDTFAELDAVSPRLSDLNVIGLKQVCRYLEIPFDYKRASDLDFDHARVSHPGQWALEICAHENASAYLNPSGGKSIFVREEWAERGIELGFTRMPDLRYEVFGDFQFQPNLSILDCLMWMEPTDIKAYLETLSIDKG